MALNESLQKQISDLLTHNRVVLFMKGTRQMPQCGFSAQVVQILDKLVPSYETIDVLRSPELRDGIKEFSQWPTIPQLFVGGEFVGGCDIVREMNASGELPKLLGTEVTEPVTPTIIVSEAATKALGAAAADANGDPLRLKVDANFQYDLSFGPREPGDIEVNQTGLTLLLDRPSAGRANGVSIEFVDGLSGGFKINNPNEPPKVKQLSAPELKTMIERDEVTLFDVRPADERAIARIVAVRSSMRQVKSTCSDSTATRRSRSIATMESAARKLPSSCFAKVSVMFTTSRAASTRGRRASIHRCRVTEV